MFYTSMGSLFSRILNIPEAARYWSRSERRNKSTVTTFSRVPKHWGSLGRVTIVLTAHPQMSCFLFNHEFIVNIFHINLRPHKNSLTCNTFIVWAAKSYKITSAVVLLTKTLSRGFLDIKKKKKKLCRVWKCYEKYTQKK